MASQYIHSPQSVWCANVRSRRRNHRHTALECLSEKQYLLYCESQPPLWNRHSFVPINYSCLLGVHISFNRSRISEGNSNVFSCKWNVRGKADATNRRQERRRLAGVDDNRQTISRRS